MKKYRGGLQVNDFEHNIVIFRFLKVQISRSGNASAPSLLPQILSRNELSGDNLDYSLNNCKVRFISCAHPPYT